MSIIAGRNTLADQPGHHRVPLRDHHPARPPTWFIARSHRFTTPKLHWRRGALMTDAADRHHALLTGRPRRPQRRADRAWSPAAELLRAPSRLLRRHDSAVSGTAHPSGPHGAVPEARLQREPSRSTIWRLITTRATNTSAVTAAATRYFGGRTSLRRPPGRHEVAIRQLSDQIDRSLTQIDELRTYLEREFTNAFFREQSLSESHCPSVFTLEIDRLPL